MGDVVDARWRGGLTLLALLLAAVVSLSACSSSSRSRSAGSSSSSGRSAPSSTSPGSAPTSADAPAIENTGIKVTGAFDSKPTVSFPASQPPKQLIEQTLVAGRG